MRPDASASVCPAVSGTVLRTQRTEPLVPLRTRRRSDFRETPPSGRNAAPSFSGRFEKLDQNFKGFKVRTKQRGFSLFPSGKEKEFAGTARTRARHTHTRSGNPGQRFRVLLPRFPCFLPTTMANWVGGVGGDRTTHAHRSCHRYFPRSTETLTERPLGL